MVVVFCAASIESFKVISVMLESETSSIFIILVVGNSLILNRSVHLCLYLG